MTFVLALLLAGAGLLLLALAMRRHWLDLFGPRPPPAVALRLIGAGLLGASLAISMGLWGRSVGVVAWFGLLSTTGLAVILCLSTLSVRR